MCVRQVSSFLSTNTDEDEISVFVQDIDSRKPLSGRHRILDDEKRQREASDDSVETPREERDPGLLLRPSGDDEQATVRRLGKLPLGADPSRDPLPQLQDRFAKLTTSGSNEEHLGRRPLGPSGLGVVIGAATAGASTLSSIGTPTPTSATPRTALDVVGSPPGVVLTSQADIDEKLKRMNENFLSSLEGLGSGRPRPNRGGNGAPVTESTSGVGGGGAGGEADGTESEEGLFARRYPLGRPFVERRREVSLSGSGSVGMGSQEVMGRMEVDYPNRR